MRERGVPCRCAGSSSFLAESNKQGWNDPSISKLPQHLRLFMSPVGGHPKCYSQT